MMPACNYGLNTIWLRLGLTNGVGVLDVDVNDTKTIGDLGPLITEAIDGRRCRIIGLYAVTDKVPSEIGTLAFGGTQPVSSGWPASPFFVAEFNAVVTDYRWRITLFSATPGVAILALVALDPLPNPV